MVVMWVMVMVTQIHMGEPFDRDRGYCPNLVPDKVIFFEIFASSLGSFLEAQSTCKQSR
jgi:hypothetical protein